jgi:hypothetical protein
MARIDPHLRPGSPSYASDPREPEALRREHNRVNVETRKHIQIVVFALLVLIAVGALIFSFLPSHG